MRHGLALLAILTISAVPDAITNVYVAELYDADGYRPRVQHLIGKPMFLY